MTPDAFITTWQANTRNEAAGSKAHFNDLFALLGVPTPQSDPTGATYAFEKGVKKSTGGGGWADVWKRGCFGWEYQTRGHDLEKAHDQLLRYAGALENPPLLVTSDMDRIIVRTNWTNVISERQEFNLEDLRDSSLRAKLRTCWTDPERWRPATTHQALTEKAAGDFAELARSLRERGLDSDKRSQLGAHYTDRDKIGLLADAVVIQPLLAEWATVSTAIASAMTQRADLVDIVPGFPDRIPPKNEAAAKILKTPEGAWLDNLHRNLDQAVAFAYGWPEDLSTEAALSNLLALNHTRAKQHAWIPLNPPDQAPPQVPRAPAGRPASRVQFAPPFADRLVCCAVPARVSSVSSVPPAAIQNACAISGRSSGNTAG